MIPERKSTLLHLFNKFAGREVLHPMAMGIDPTIQEMQRVAWDNGLVMRVLLPGAVGTKDVRTNRINVHIEEGADGKYRVSNRFNIG